MQTSSKRSLHPSDQVADQRMKSAGLRAIESYQRVRSKAERLIEEIDDLTPVHGVPTYLTEEDSVVTTIQDVIASHTSK